MLICINTLAMLSHSAWAGAKCHRVAGLKQHLLLIVLKAGKIKFKVLCLEKTCCLVHSTWPPGVFLCVHRVGLVEGTKLSGDPL